MPVCPLCDVAYIQDERHICPPPRRVPWVSIATVTFALLFPLVTVFLMVTLSETHWRNQSAPEWLGLAAWSSPAIGFAALVRRWPGYWLVIAIFYIPMMVAAILGFGVAVACSYGDCL